MNVSARRREALLSFPPDSRAGGAANVFLDAVLPPAALLFAAGVLVFLVRGAPPAISVFPWATGGLCFAFLAGGAFAAAAVGAAATLGAFVAVFYAPDLPQQLLLFIHVVILWGCFAQFLRADMDRKSAEGRRADRADRLRLETARRTAESEECRGELAAAQERVAAYNRLRFFADDLIGDYNREELARRSEEGLAGLFPRSAARVTLFPSSDEPGPADDVGRRALRQGGPRLYPDVASRLPSRDTGRFLLLPLRVRESAIGCISLARPPNEKPFDLQDLRLSLIGVDLIAMALGNAERYAQIESLAVSDGLTGLFTRGYLDERLQEEFAKARHQGRPFSVILLDVDHFKKVNDAHGHRLGDEVLRWLARQIMAQSRDTDFVARYGGEEFIVLMPNTGGKDALAFGRRLGKAVADAVFRWEKTSLKVTVSGGVAQISDDVTDEQDLIGRADRALYRAKNGGRNQVLPHE